MRAISSRLRGTAIASAVALIAGISAVASLKPYPAQSQPQGFTFALIGDMAYYEEHEPWLANVYAEISKDRHWHLSRMSGICPARCARVAKRP